MGTKAQIAPADYLRMTFPDRVEPELVDGELRERALPTYTHGAVQWLIASLLKRAGLHTAVELRVKVNAGDYRVVDVAAYRERPEELPSNPAFVTVEVLSPDERHGDILEKCEDYAAWGVEHIWLVDMNRQRLHIYEEASLKTVDALRLPEFGVEITVASLLAGLE